MRKQGLMHTHALLAEIVQYYERKENAEIPREAYDQIDVHPTSIPASKTEHKRAVIALADAITDATDKKTDDKSQHLIRTSD